MATRNSHYVEERNSMIIEKILLILAVVAVIAGAVLGFMGSWHITLICAGIAFMCITVIVGRLSESGHQKKWVVFFLSIIAIAFIASGLGLFLLPIEKFLTVILPGVLFFIFLLAGVFFVISGAKNRDPLSVVMGILFLIIAILIVAIVIFVFGGF